MEDRRFLWRCTISVTTSFRPHARPLRPAQDGRLTRRRQGRPSSGWKGPYSVLPHGGSSPWAKDAFRKQDECGQYGVRRDQHGEHQQNEQHASGPSSLQSHIEMVQATTRSFSSFECVATRCYSFLSLVQNSNPAVRPHPAKTYEIYIKVGHVATRIYMEPTPLIAQGTLGRHMPRENPRATASR